MRLKQLVEGRTIKILLQLDQFGRAIATVSIPNFASSNRIFH